MKEALKTAALLGLIAGALALSWLTWFYDTELPGLRLFGAEEMFPPAEAGRMELRPAAWPVESCVLSDGVRVGRRQDTAGISQLYNAIPLGLALGRAQNPQALTRDEWESALRRNSVCFRFAGSVPAAALAAWQSVEASAEMTGDISRLAVVQDGENAALLIQTGDLSFTRYDTATAFSVFSGAVLPELTAGWASCAFAFELEEPLAGLEPETLLFDGVPAARTARLHPVSDLSGLLDAMRRALNIPRTTTSYPEADGATVYVDNLRTLLLSKDGDVLYRNPDGGGSALPGENACIEEARTLVAAAEPFLGDAKLPLDHVSRDGDAFTVRFGYELDGLPVELAPRCEVRFQNGVMTEARLTLRTLTLDEGVSGLLPERQAAALADAPESRFGLVYFETGQGVLRPEWAVR